MTAKTDTCRAVVAAAGGSAGVWAQSRKLSRGRQHVPNGVYC